MGAFTTRLTRAQAQASSIAAKRQGPRERLEGIVEAALEVAGGERAFLIVPKPQDPYEVHTARSVDKVAVTKDQLVVSKELLDHARNMKDAVVSRRPFATLEGVKGEYAVKGETLSAAAGLRSAIVAPLVHDGRVFGALVLHEANRSEPFSLDDRRILEPLVQFGARTIAGSIEMERARIGAPIVERTHPAERHAGLIGLSRAFLEVEERALMAARAAATVLICGESGTGKERFAKLIHDHSRWAKGPFEAVNAGCLGELAAAELNGYVKGSFTGALADKKGLLEQTSGGTLLLDEIGEMPLDGQAVLLRILQEKKVRPIGGVEKPVQVRIVAATNRHLETMVREGKFREDLLMRLNVLRLDLPPLRDREGDLDVLVPILVERVAAYNGLEPKAVTHAAMERLRAYPWPGNVRELENTLTRALVYSKKPALDADDMKLAEVAVVTKNAVARFGANERGYIRVVASLATVAECKEPWAAIGLSRTTFFNYVRAGREMDPERAGLPDWYRRRFRASETETDAAE